MTHRLIIAALVCLLVVACGQPDSSTNYSIPVVPFGDEGMMKYKIGNYQENGDRLQKVLTQTDGKIIVVGTSSFEDSSDCVPDSVQETICRPRRDVVAIRMTNDGAMDVNFAGGYALVNRGFQDYALDALVDVEGKVVVLARTNGIQNTVPKTYLTRFNLDGTIDKSYGQGGYAQVHTDMMTGEVHRLGQSKTGQTFVAAQRLNRVSIWSFDRKGAALLRFGTGGEMVLPTPSVLQAFHVAQNGEVMVAGAMETGKIVMYRMNNWGRLEKTFGSSGSVTFQHPSTNQLRVSSMDRFDNRIAVSLVTGHSGEKIASSVFVFRNNGNVDVDFANEGHKDFSQLETKIETLRYRNDGRLLVAGRRSQLCAMGLFDLTGTVDASFANGKGWASCGVSIVPPDLTTDALGRIIVGATNSGYIAYRYKADGTLDGAKMSEVPESPTEQ